MNWWTFHEQDLDWEIERHKGARQLQGATPEQARAEAELIKRFMLGAEVLKGPQPRTPAEIRASGEKVRG